jgi:tetratricopeptide (TPR) repeat protein
MKGAVMKAKLFLIAVGILAVLNNPASAQTTSTDRYNASSSMNAREAIKRGNIRYSNAQYAEAIEAYQNVGREAGPTYAEALFNIGVCYYEMWKTDRAIEMYRQAVEARGGNYPKALYAMGVALEDLGKTGEAKQEYSRAVAISAHEFAPASYKLGLILAREGKYSNAAKLFREAIANSSYRFPASRNNLGVMLANLGSFREAEHEFQLALEEAGGTFTEASYNLKLCQTVISARVTPQTADLRMAVDVNGLFKNVNERHFDDGHKGK